MSEDNIIKIVISLITLFGTLIGVYVGHIGKSRKETRENAKREQYQNDLFAQILTEIEGVKKRLDVHNKYAEKFAEVEISLTNIKKDIEYLRKENHEKESN